MLAYLCMNGTILKNKEILSLNIAKIRRLFSVGSEITELAEEVLEELGEYKQEFILGLEKSVKEAKDGKIKEIKSLKDLR